MVFPLVNRLLLSPCQRQVSALQTLAITGSPGSGAASGRYRTVDQSALVVYIACAWVLWHWYSGSATGLRRVP